MNPRYRKLAGALAAAALAAGLAMAGTGTAHADPVPPATTWAEIFNPHLSAQGNTLCVDDPGGSRANLQPIDLFHCHGYASNGTPQRWDFILDGNTGIFANFSTYHMINTGSGYCIGISPNIPNFNSSAGTDIVQESCLDSLDTDWILVPVDRSNPNSDFQLETLRGYPFIPTWCMAASNFTDNNTRLVMERCSSSDTRQLWNLG